jgi:hypothetical protein
LLVATVGTEGRDGAQCPTAGFGMLVM